MSSYELAAAFGSSSSLQHPSSSYHSLAGLDPFDSASDSPFQGSTQGVHPSHPSSSSGLSAAHDVQAAFHPSAYSNANTLAFQQALADAFVSAHVQQQRPVSPHSQVPYTSLRWPAAGHMNHLGLEPMDPLFAPASTQPLFPPSLPAHSVYQSDSQAAQTLQDHQQAAAQPSWSVTGSLDPATGVYQRVPEHPRMRTAQACEKCRVRKAKCSGEHPTCARCRMRGLVCEYAPERKMRGPNKVKRRSVDAASTSTERRASCPSADERRMSDASTSGDVDPNYRFPENGDAKPVSPPQSRTPASEPVSSPLRFPVGTSPEHDHEREYEAEARSTARRARPQSIDLGSAAFFAPHPFPHAYQHESAQEHSERQHQPYTRQVHLLPPVDYAARRQSLPAYVHVLSLSAHAAAQRAQGLGLDALGSGSGSGRRSGSGSHSGSESSGVAPPTPLELPESLVGGELVYPAMEMEMGMGMDVRGEQGEMQFGDDPFKLPEPTLGMGMEMGEEMEMGTDEEKRGDVEVPIDPALLAE
ncbi:uncharacterized protein LAESUDRAFT_764217 [Laetiporus sulphureus 93-53]|uniref:Zn(2)-C6 fungal-type domain-containing protein n=1 Tax=Laetiporus sulphureus 93-53 TaxID=1314785 RepID=A0A165BEU2_9APHY|nr:uncharacterized protein LAESUDRAFT_764217 [Laetiporus sulphureus 93-53]KZT00900.1 hypothetical protein LAESUDRAFT_764217 [Laetiporus sulphureus 93-53]